MSSVELKATQGLLQMRMNGNTTLDQLFCGHLTAFDQCDPKIGENLRQIWAEISPSCGTMGAMMGWGEVKQPAGRPHFLMDHFSSPNFTPALDANCNDMLLF